MRWSDRYAKHDELSTRYGELLREINTESFLTSAMDEGVFRDIPEFIRHVSSEITRLEDRAPQVPKTRATSTTGQKTVSGLSPGTAYWFWVELIDSAGNSSGIQPIGSQETPSVTAIDGSLATVTSTNPSFDKDLFSADYIFDGSFLWDNHIFASPENTPPVTITFTLSQPKKIVGFRVYSATRIAENEPHSFPGR
eukprot:jgi/Tetstr1/423849/TSEL_014475.t1